MDRVIIHIDMDAFYASVEQLDNSALKGKPIAVGGSRERGVIAAASYEARKYGVRSAMPSITAYRLCPQLIFVKPRFSRYKEISEKVMSVFKAHTDLVEPLSLDEAYLDVSELSGTITPMEIAESIRKEIKESIGLTCSAGVSYNKFLAKMASDVNKPNGVKVLFGEEAIEFLADLPIKRFYGIGEKTAERLYKNGIFKGRDLQKLPIERLNILFGKNGRFYYNIIRGIDNRSVVANRIRKSIGVERTFQKDLATIDLLKEEMIRLVEELSRRLQKTNTKGKLLSIKIKYADFQIQTRAIPLAEMTNDRSFIEEKTIEELLFILTQNTRSIRLLGLSMSKLDNTESDNIQLEINFPG